MASSGWDIHEVGCQGSAMGICRKEGHTLLHRIWKWLVNLISFVHKEHTWLSVKYKHMLTFLAFLLLITLYLGFRFHLFLQQILVEHLICSRPKKDLVVVKENAMNYAGPAGIKQGGLQQTKTCGCRSPGHGHAAAIGPRRHPCRQSLYSSGLSGLVCLIGAGPIEFWCLPWIIPFFFSFSAWIEAWKEEFKSSVFTSAATKQK